MAFGEGDNAAPRNVVLWEGASQEASWDKPDDTATADGPTAVCGPTFASGLGEVRYCVRDGRRRNGGYSVRAARLTDDGLLLPLPHLASSPRCREGVPWDDVDSGAGASVAMTLHNW